ncbi:MAG: PAS domain S-box protein, partial [Candidatus Atribacteria bacterium]|nr:PAS domain S-box protein [Candidatus Atribacteria bacterium]
MVLFLSLLLLAAFSLHGLFLLLGRGFLFSWRFAVNGLVILFLAIFSFKFLLVALRSTFFWMGMWFIFLGEALFLVEYPTRFTVQEVLHGAFLLGGSFLVVLGLWQEKRQSFYPGMEEFLEQISKPALFLDEAGRIQGMNAKATDLLGYAFTDLKGCPFVRFLPPAIQEKAWDRFRKIQKGKSEDTLFWITTKEGKEILVRAIPLFPVPGNEEGLVFELEDVTRSRLNRLSFYREGRRLRNYLEAVQDIFLILDEEGKVQYINRVGSALLGVRRKEILGQTLERFIRDEEHSREKLVFQKLREGQPIPEDERIVSVLTKRGEVRQIRWNYRVLSDSAGT